MPRKAEMPRKQSPSPNATERESVCSRRDASKQINDLWKILRELLLWWLLDGFPLGGTTAENKMGMIGRHPWAVVNI